MLGGTLYRIVMWAVAAAVALLIGSQLLSSVHAIVLSFRLGNFVPFASILLVSSILAWLSGREYDWKVADLTINIIAGVATVVSTLSVFFTLLPIGILLSITGSGIFVGGLTIVRTPSLAEKIEESQIAGSLRQIDWLRGLQNKAVMAQKVLETLDVSVLLLPAGSIRKILPILRERPRLAIAVSRLLDTDAIFIRSSDSEHVSRIVEVLKGANISSPKRIPALFSKFLLTLPLLENYTLFPDYMAVKEDTTIERLISDESIQLTLHSSSSGPIIVAAKRDTLGMEALEIPPGHLHTVLLKRNIEGLLQLIEVYQNAT